MSLPKFIFKLYIFLNLCRFGQVAVPQPPPHFLVYLGFLCKVCPATIGAPLPPWGLPSGVFMELILSSSAANSWTRSCLFLLIVLREKPDAWKAVGLYVLVLVVSPCRQIAVRSGGDTLMAPDVQQLVVLPCPLPISTPQWIHHGQVCELHQATELT